VSRLLSLVFDGKHRVSFGRSIEVILSPIFVSRMLEGFPVGNCSPYRGGTQHDIINHLENVVEELTKSSTLRVERDFGMLLDGAATSGYAYCCKKRDWPTDRIWDDYHVQGIVIVLSSLAPIAFYCPLKLHQSPRGKSYAYNFREAGTLPSGEWENETEWVVARLKNSGFEIPSREKLIEALPSEPWIPKHMWGRESAYLFF
jgi:hypothetical protein